MLDEGYAIVQIRAAATGRARSLSLPDLEALIAGTESEMARLADGERRAALQVTVTAFKQVLHERENPGAEESGSRQS